MPDSVPPLVYPQQGYLPGLGGKSRGLTQLYQAALPVPSFFTVPGEWFTRVLVPRLTDLLGRLERIAVEDDAGLRQLSAEFRARVTEVGLPANLTQQVVAAARELSNDGEMFLAVRSSATSEDGEVYSFAGQFSSRLGATWQDVESAVLECWASAFSPHVLAYSKRVGAHALPAVAVVVQVLIDSARSGVAFTSNPHGNLDELVIVAGYGLGEGVVADRVRADTYFYDRRRSSWAVEVVEKREQIVRDGNGGTAVVAVDGERVTSAVLDAPRREQLRATCERLEQTLGPYQDVEWAFDAFGTLWLTQTRPITTIPRGEDSVFDNSNIVESYPGVSLPSTFSYVQTVYARVFRAAVGKLGVPERDLETHEDVWSSLVGYAQGRIYYNLTAWYQMFRLIPGTRAYIPVWEQMLGIDQQRRVASQGAKNSWSSLLRLGWSLVVHFVMLGPRLAGIRRGLQQTTARLTALESLESHQLEREFLHMTGPGMRGWEITLLNDGYAFIFSALVRALLKRWGLDEGLFGKLMAGDERLESVEPVRSAVGMAEWLRARPVLAAALSRPFPTAQDLETQLASNEYAEFTELFHRHLAAYGDRGPAELKLESITLRDDPRLLLRIVLRYVPEDLTVQRMVEGEQAVRRDAENTVRHQLRYRLLSRLLFAFCLAMARRSIRYRESSRLDRSRAFGLTRRLFATLGRQLHTLGALHDARDVFFLRHQDVFDFVRGKWVDTDLASTVERRKSTFERYQQNTPQERFRTSGPVGANVIPLAREAKDEAPSVSASGERCLRGQGCSTGVVVGEAVVITDPNTTADVRGKILVAPMTDPGWVFLMVGAAGLIVERGSLLSHTAIIGRELGKPTVVGVAGATRLIRDGDRIELDGASGTIRWLE